MKPFISVIIPIWNVEPYLHTCLDSICSQTLNKLEIICINDYSQDRCSQILHTYAERDNRLLIIDLNKNTGAAIARNIGISVASGKYLGFIDPDDSINDIFYENLYNIANKTDADVVKGIAYRLTNDGNIYYKGNNNTILKDKFNFKSEFWSAIYKTEIVKNFSIDFPADVPSGQDFAFLLKFMATDPHIELTDKSIYYYLSRPFSKSNTSFNKQLADGIIIAFDDIYNFLKNKSTLNNDKLYCYIVHIINYILSYDRKMDIDTKQYIKYKLSLYLHNIFINIPHINIFHKYIKQNYPILSIILNRLHPSYEIDNIYSILISNNPYLNIIRENISINLKYNTPKTNKL